MPAVDKEFSKPKVLTILTNARLLFPSRIRAEYAKKCPAERQISQDTFKISREVVPLSWQQKSWASDNTYGKSSKMATTGMQMDPLFLAMSFYRRRKFEECAEVCTQLLKKNPYDQVVHFLRNPKKVPLITTLNYLKQTYTRTLLIFLFSEALFYEWYFRLWSGIMVS